MADGGAAVRGEGAARNAWIERALGVALGDVPPPRAIDAAAIPTPPADGLEAWSTARNNAVATLQALEKEYREFDDLDCADAIIRVRAIRANLTPRPQTLRQVAELERYVSTDDIVADAEIENGFGIKVDLVRPLSAALARLRADLQAQGARA